jgi:hypothetical protein
MLEKQSHSWLVERLLDLTGIDSANTDRIMLSLSAEHSNGVKVIAHFKRQIDKATADIEDHGPGTWESNLPSEGFDAVADALTIVLSKNMINAVIQTTEYALVKLDSIFELQDECELEYLVDAFRHLHLEACHRSTPDVCSLGSRLAELSQQTEWGFFDGPPDGYAHILGQNGLAVYLAKLAPEKSGKK